MMIVFVGQRPLPPETASGRLPYNSSMFAPLAAEFQFMTLETPNAEIKVDMHNH